MIDTKNIALSLFTLLLLCVVSVAFLLVYRCTPWNCAPSRPFDVYAFKLPLDFFPEDAIGEAMYPSSELNGANSFGSMNIFWDNGNGRSIYHVLQFSSNLRASRYYEYGQEVYIQKIKFDMVANEYSSGCGNSQFGGYVCEMSARCQEFVFYFNAVISPQMMQEQFELIVHEINDQMKTKLNSCSRAISY